MIEGEPNELHRVYQADPARSPERGATLLEILVVLSIIALLAAVVGPRVVGYLSKAKSQTAGFQLDSLKSANEFFFIDMGRYPTEQEGLNALLAAPPGAENWGGPYLEAPEALTDPWGRAYLYKSPGANGRDYSITTLGQDGAEGGSGEDADITR